MGQCWEWRRARKGGAGYPYGSVHFAEKAFGTHRVSYFLTYQTDPKHLHVLHRCDNPPCCNPSHLFLGTPVTNRRDAQAKGRLPKPRRNPNQRISRGAEHGCAKLKQAEVDELRRLFALGVSRTLLRAMFLISKSQCQRIVTGASW